MELNLTDEVFKIIPELYEPTGSKFYKWEWRVSQRKEEKFQKRLGKIFQSKRIPIHKKLDEGMWALRGKFINPGDLLYIFNCDWPLDRDMQGDFIFDPEDEQLRVRHIAKVVSEYGLRVQKLTKDEREWWGKWLMTHKMSDIPCDLKRYQVSKAWKARYDLPRDPLFSGIPMMFLDFANLGVLFNRMCNPDWAVQLYKWAPRGRASTLLRAIPELLASWLVGLFILPLMAVTVLFKGLIRFSRFLEWWPIRIVTDILAVISGILIAMLVADTIAGRKKRASGLDPNLWGKYNEASRRRLMDANIPYPEAWKNKIL